MLDGLSFDPLTLLDDAYNPAEVGVCTDLRLGPSSRPLPYRLPTPCTGRSRCQHPQLSHEVFCLVEENCHFVALCLYLQRLPTVPILRVVGASPDCLRPSRSVIAANSHAKRGWVEALGTPRLARSRAARGLA